MQREIIIFAREPIAGRTKTRLCPPLDGAMAAALYACFLRDVLAIACALEGVHVMIAYTPESDHHFFTECAPHVQAYPQRGDDLGQRLDNALVKRLDAGAAQVVIIGSDSPNLPADYMKQAFADLDAGADVVLGPSDDGGYYLIGLCSHQPRLLREVPMSTPTVLADTRAIAEELHLRVALLPRWYDVDTVAELGHLAQHLRDAPVDIAPHTRSMLPRIAQLVSGGTDEPGYPLLDESNVR